MKQAQANSWRVYYDCMFDGWVAVWVDTDSPRWFDRAFDTWRDAYNFADQVARR